MEKKIFKEKQLKKTLIESVENPLTGEIIGAVKINNNNEVDFGRGIIKVDADQNPILTQQEEKIMADERKMANTDNPMEAHRMAVENNGNGNGNNNGKNEVKENNEE